MDLEVIHAVAPDAKKVLVNARPTVEGDGSYTKIAEMMEDADRRYPGAVWSFSIGWGCDRLITAADLVPVRAALAKAQSNGTAAVDASGDLAGLECKGGREWSSAPHADDTGVKNDLALVAFDTGPYHAFGPDFGPGPPSGANLEIAQDMAKYVNSFRWSGDPDR